MRRRPLILLLLAAGALAVVGVALADPPQTTTAVKALGESPDAQVGPAIAVDPAGGTNVQAVALDTDWRSGALKPQTGYATGMISSASGATSWNDFGFLPPVTSGSDTSGGSPDVIWGPANKVYAVEVGRDVGAPQNPCDSAAGLYYSFSINAGATWSTFQLAPNGPNLINSDPSITYSPSTGLIYVAYTRQDCSGGASFIRVVTTAADGTGDQPIGTVSPVPAPPDAQYEHPSIAALPNGKVAIAYYDAAQSHVLVTTCSPSGDPAAAASCAPTPVTVDSSASEPPSGLLGGLPVSVHPSIAAGSDGRVVVVWAKQTALGMDVFSATSRDYGASFGQPVRVPADPGAGDQFDPSIAIAPDGRADIAFFTSAPGGYLVAASASNHPSGSLNAETWSQSVPVESSPIAPVAAFSGGSPTLGSRLGVDEVPRGASGRAWTLIAWADTRNLGQGSQNEDVYSTVLLHQSTTPVGVDTPAVNVPKNVTWPVNFTATDADADPLTYSIAQQGAIGTASIPDPNAPVFMYQAPKVEGPDQVQIRLDDGVHQSTMTVKLNIVNTPPTITCTSLTTEADTPVSITAANCASDLNGDSVTLTASNPSHGKLQPSGGGVNFAPDTGFIGTGQVTLSATDGSAPPVTLTIPVYVTAHTAIKVMIVGSTSRSARTDRPIKLHAIAASPTNQLIIWKFGDKTTDQGSYVSHLFQTAGTYDVTAQVGDNGTPEHIKVIVQKPPLSLKQTTVDGHGTVGLRVQLANSGTLTVGMVGVPGAHPTKQKMKRGTHTVQLKLPQSVRNRGVVLVNLTLSLGAGRPERVKRAVMLPRDQSP
jgi:hypothetical protein